MEELRDIAGISPVMWWPLATGWWIVIFLCMSALFVGLVCAYKRYRYWNSWQGRAYQNLSLLEYELQNIDLKLCVRNLSQEIRNIAMLSASRDSCASLSSKDWLFWLQKNDPNGFAWTTEAEILSKQQYAPEIKYDVESIRCIIKAIKVWVRK